MATLNVQGGALTFLDGSIGNSAISTTANIEAGKLKHRHAIRHSQNIAAVVAAETVQIYTAYKSGTIVSVIVHPRAVPTSNAYSVDVRKGAALAASSSVLSAVVSVTTGTQAQANLSGTLATTTYSAGDTFEIVIAQVGGSPANALGVCITLILDEDGN